MTERDDLILDACLTEVLGGRTPPDLSARILQAWAQRQAAEAGLVESASPTGPQVVAPPPVQIVAGVNGAHGGWPAPTPVPPPIAAAPVPPARDLGWVAPAGRITAGSSRGRAAANAASGWQSVALVLAVLFTGTVAGLLALNSSPKDRPVTAAIAKNGSAAQSGSAAVHSSRKAPPRTSVAPGRPGGESAATRGAAVAAAPHGSPAGQDPDSTPPTATPLAPSASLATTESDEAVIRGIDDVLRREWQAAGVVPSEPATDAEWCRRVYLRVIGRIPTVEEVERFAANRSSHKRAELVDELLGPPYAEAYASHWATIWANTLLGRRDPDKSLANRDGLHEYLRLAVAGRKPYDQLATELIAATGSNRSTDGDYNPAVNFLLAHGQGNGTQAAGRVARVFLGARLQCAECHVHPSGSWSQEQMWQLAAFFRQMKPSRNAKEGTARLVNEDFQGKSTNPHEAASYFELASGQLKAAFPVFLDGTAGSRSGLVAEVDRRAELARFVTHSPQFSQTIVNRLWAHFLGFGFTQPIDDLGPHNRPSHPEILERLAGDFAQQGYDLRRLTRWIVLSEPFGLSSKEMPDGLVDAPEQGRRPLFARYYSRPMQPEELSKSLQLLADARGQGSSVSADQARLLRQLGRALPTDDTDSPPGTRLRIPQGLIDVQRDLVGHSLEGVDAGLVHKVAANRAMSSDEKIDHLFQAALARKPSGQELQAARRLVAESPADVERGLQDLWWVLLNSNEFILDH